ncbi:hypothetical protein DEO72_LG6g1821 [Vigna unguiculata]|uniref:Uncharacterized protein n=1 Tax=Vigna unguiculata TaxID=3917 RepID=A0A4D6M9P9_VIGUN|nr:hypothetical protein DEO72_LG6g1821 [Vigna unguiculata]
MPSISKLAKNPECPSSTAVMVPPTLVSVKLNGLTNNIGFSFIHLSTGVFHSPLLYKASASLFFLIHSPRRRTKLKHREQLNLVDDESAASHDYDRAAITSQTPRKGDRRGTGPFLLRFALIDHVPFWP